ncbi:hypothetical protein [Flavobacterium sp. HNIBRBA15423]|uniref:hypothetical protein n=1 Tax=Flavobacterium sp. HNIBRBA15423 TaxID=3458683 RepID=UPI004044839D
MTRTRFVKGTITEKTGGNEIYYAEGNIVINAGKKINITSRSGVFFDEPEKYEPQEELSIAKIEGPFDKDGKIVKIVKKEVFYTYKATPSRNPSESEVRALKWSTKNDKGKIKTLLNTSSNNKLIDGKIIIAISINTECEKATVYAHFNKPVDEVSVITQVLLEEVLLIVGTEQHSQTYGNKMMFPAQAVREVRENYINKIKVTILIFTDGFNAEELSTISKDGKAHNSKLYFKKINSVSELIDYINNGDGSVNRENVKIGTIKIFSHGLPSILDFGLDGNNSSTQRFQKSDVSKLKVESFIEKATIYSYACRTGNSDSSIFASRDGYQYGSDWVTSVKPQESLAQELSNHLDAIVYAFLRRSNYTSTWLDNGDTVYKDKYITIEDEEVSSPVNPIDWYRATNVGWDEALWNPDGAYKKPTVGNSPGGLLPRDIYKFEKGKTPSK